MAAAVLRGRDVGGTSLQLPRRITCRIRGYIPPFKSTSPRFPLSSNRSTIPSPLPGEPAPADTPRANSVSECPASRRGEGEGRARGKEGGAKRALASGAVIIAGGEFAPERRPSLKGIGWCRRAIYGAPPHQLALNRPALIYERNGKTEDGQGRSNPSRDKGRGKGASGALQGARRPAHPRRQGDRDREKSHQGKRPDRHRKRANGSPWRSP